MSRMGASHAASVVVRPETKMKFLCPVGACPIIPSLAEPFFAVAIGPCEHDQVCARCCLRLRMCYGDNRCPLCKNVNKQIVVMRPPPIDTLAVGAPQPPCFNDLLGRGSRLMGKAKWAEGIWVVEEGGDGNGSSSKDIQRDSNAASSLPMVMPSNGARRKPLRISLMQV